MADAVASHISDEVRKASPLRSASRKRLLGELLLEEGLINADQLAEALSVQSARGGKLGETLINLGHLKPTTFQSFLARQDGVVSIDLANYDIPPECIHLIPKEYALKHDVVPLDRMGNLLTVGMACPLDSFAVQELQEITGLRIKAFLCHPDDIHNIIRRHYASSQRAVLDPYRNDNGAWMASLAYRDGKTDAASLLRHVETLPVLAWTVERMRDAFRVPACTVASLAQIVAMDPPLAAQVIGAANTRGGTEWSVDTIARAITVLGLGETYRIATSAPVVDLDAPLGAIDYRAYWHESIFCATATVEVSKTAKMKHNDTAYAAGLLHDIGRLAMAHALPDEYAAIGKSQMGNDLLRAEYERLETDHTEVGAQLADEWALPEPIRQAISHHHTPARAKSHRGLTAAVAIAAMVTQGRSNGAAHGRRLAILCEEPLDILDLNNRTGFDLLERLCDLKKQLLSRA